MAALKRRRAGRPAQSAVSAEAILKEALTLLEERGITGVSMRAIAQRLSVDPMSLYHYFPDKDALLREAAAVAYAGFEAPASRSASPRKRLEALGGAYLTFVEQRSELLRYMSARASVAAGPVRAFDVHFRVAVEPLGLSERQLSIAQGVFVDFIHGFTMAPKQGAEGAPTRRLFFEELAVLVAGIESLAKGGSLVG